MEPPLIPLIKSKNDTKSDINCVKIKFCRDPTSEKSDLYESKTSLFDCGETEEFLFFVRNLKMTFEASVTLAADANIQYLCTLVCGE